MQNTSFITRFFPLYNYICEEKCINNNNKIMFVDKFAKQMAICR